MDIELILPVGPRQAQPLNFTIVGEIEDEHLEMISSGVPRSRGSSLKRISERHKAMARAIANGTAVSDVAFYFSLEVMSVRHLMRDPAFKNLVAFYQRAEDEIVMSTQERLTRASNEALDLIQERFENEETRAKITIPQALEVAQMGADRTGNGPQSSTVAVNVHVGLADRLKAARERAAEAMRDITPRVAAE